MSKTSHEFYWLGIALGRREIIASAALLDTMPRRWRTVPTARFENSCQGIRRMLEWLRGVTPEESACAGICVETSSGLSRQFAQDLARVCPKMPPLSPVRRRDVRAFGLSLGACRGEERPSAALLAVYGTACQPIQSIPHVREYDRLDELSSLCGALRNHLDKTVGRLRGASDPVDREILTRRARGLRRTLGRLGYTLDRGRHLLLMSLC